MRFSNTYEDDEEYEIIECTKLNNDILIYKKELDKIQPYVIKLKGNQYAVLFEEGQVLDIVNEEGIYTLKNEPSSTFPEDLNDYQIKDNKDSLCILFFNTDIITDNKFYIKKRPIKKIYGEGNFDFQIKSPLKLFNKVITIRTYYSKEELLEQIRERISKIVTNVIKEHKDEYELYEQYIDSSVNIFKEYGIKIVNSNIKDIQFKKKF